MRKALPAMSRGRFAQRLSEGADSIEFAVGAFAAIVLSVVLIEWLAFAFRTPHVSEIAAAVKEMTVQGILPLDVFITGTRWLVGWIVGTVLGLAVGLATGRSAAARLGFEKFLTLLRAIPIICLVPLSIRFFGLEEAGKYFVVGWAVFFICWLAMHQAVSTIPEEANWRAQSLRLRKFDWFWAVLAPHVGPAVYVALRTSLLLGLIVTAVAELSGVYQRSSGVFWSEGLGYRIFRTLDQARDDQLFATILTFSLLGVLGEVILRFLWNSSANALKRRRIQRARRAISQLQVLPGETHAPSSQFNPPKISITNLTVRYRGMENSVLNGLNLAIDHGRTTVILGRSGCGKTTLLRALAQINLPSMVVAGEITFNGQPADRLNIGIIPQSAPVFESLTGWANVMVGQTLRQGRAHERLHALKALKEFGIEGKLDAIAGTLSGGQRQRLAFATALLNRPQVLLCDEPYSALDAFTRRNLQAFYVDQIREKRSLTTVWITHEIDEALIVADSIYLMDEGVLTKFDLSQYRSKRDQSSWLQSSDFLEARQRILDSL